MVRGRWRRILIDLEDAKPMHNLDRALTHVGIGDNIAKRESVMDYIAIREGFESWGED